MRRGEALQGRFYDKSAVVWHNEQLFLHCKNRDIMENKEKNIPAFFAENGITATSANHLSNIAKENYMAIDKQMASLKFYRTTVNFIGSAEETVLSYGTSQEMFARIIDWVNEVIACKSLIAYLREAIRITLMSTNRKSMHCFSHCSPNIARHRRNSMESRTRSTGVLTRTGDTRMTLGRLSMKNGQIVWSL